MLVYRIASKRYIDDLSGTGAALYGGRWNPSNYPMVYFSSNKSIALLENLVRFKYKIDQMPNLYILEAKINIFESLLTITPNQLPEEWNSISPHPLTRNIGKVWIQNKKSLFLKVPSTASLGEFNILYNPNHPEASDITIQNIAKYSIDKRILQTCPRFGKIILYAHMESEFMKFASYNIPNSLSHLEIE